MKSASKVMYLLGRIFNIISLVICFVGLVLSILAVIFSKDIYESMKGHYPTNWTEASVRSTAVGSIVMSAFLFLICLVVLIIALKALKSLENDDTNSTPHVVLIVIGVFFQIFYLLGGVFGLIDAENRIRDEALKKNNEEK